MLVPTTYGSALLVFYAVILLLLLLHPRPLPAAVPRITPHLFGDERALSCELSQLH